MPSQNGKPGRWVKNFGKSIKFAAVDVLSELAPSTSATAENASGVIQELVKDLRGLRVGQTKIRQELDKIPAFRYSGDIIKNAKRDLKSGNINNQERLQKIADADMEDFDDSDFSFEDGDSEFDFSPGDKGGSSNETFSMSDDIAEGVQPIADELKPGVNATAVASQHTAIATEQFAAGQVKQTNMIVSGFDATNKVNTQIAATQFAMQSSFHRENISIFTNVDKNIEKIVRFNDETLSKHSMAAMKFYDDQLAATNNILAEIQKIREKVAPDKPEEDQESPDAPQAAQLFNGRGVMKFSKYPDILKKNFMAAADEDMLLSTIKNFLFDEDALKAIMANPLEFVSTKIVTNLIPTVVKTTLKELDETVAGFFPAIFAKINSGLDSDNPLKQLFAKIFGLRTEVKTSADFSQYEKGEVPFDGVTRTAITTVIPNYLSGILAALTGSEEQTFDYEKGVFTTKFAMAQQLQEDQLNRLTSAYSKITSEMFKTFQDNVLFQNEDQRKALIEDYLDVLSNITLGQHSIDINKEGIFQELGARDATNEKLIRAAFKNMTKGKQVGLYNSMFKAGIESTDFYDSLKDNPAALLNMLSVQGGLGYDRNIERGSGNNKWEYKMSKGNPFLPVDKFGYSQLDYLHDIKQALIDGVIVFPHNAVNSGEGNVGEPSGIPEDILKRKKDLKEKNDRQKQEEAELEESRKATNLTDEEIEEGKKSGKVYNKDIRSKAADKMIEEQIRFQKDVKADPSKKQMGGVWEWIDKMFNAKTFGERLETIKDSIGNFLKVPVNFFVESAESINKTLYTMIYGDPDTGKGILEVTVENIKQTFTKLNDWIRRKFDEVGTWLFGEGGLSEAKIYKWVKGKASDLFDYLFGKENENGNRTGGAFSGAFGALKDFGMSIRNELFGTEYTDSEGKPHPVNTNSVMHNIKSGMSDAFGAMKNYLFGPDELNKDGTKKSFMDTLADKLSVGYTNWKNFLFGSKTSEEAGQAEFKEGMEEFKKAAPKALAVGIVGAGVGLFTNFGLLGSLFLPGGPIGGAILGTAVGFLSQSEKFKEFMFGKIGEDGTRMGGIVSKGVIDWVTKHKVALLGGATFGAVKGLIGSFLPAIGGPLGFVGSFLLPGGPITGALLGAAIGIGWKSQTFQEFLYGKEGQDGQKIGGILNSEMGASFKKHLPNMAIGALGAGIGATVLGQMGFMGAMLTPMGPIGAAILGAAAGIGISSERFRNFLFGKDDEKTGFHEGGLFDKVKNFFTIELASPFKTWMQQTSENIRFWFVEKISIPFKAALKPFQVQMNLMMEDMKKLFVNGWKYLTNALDNIFERAVGLPLSKFIAEKVVDPMKKFMNTLISGIGKVFGTILSSPVKAMHFMAMSMMDSQEKRGIKENREERSSAFKGALGGLKNAIFGGGNTEEGGERKGVWDSVKDVWKTGKEAAKGYVDPTTRAADRKKYIDKDAILAEEEKAHAEARAEHERRNAEIEASRKDNKERSAIARKANFDTVLRDEKGTPIVDIRGLYDTSKPLEELALNVDTSNGFLEKIKNMIASIGASITGNTKFIDYSKQPNKPGVPASAKEMFDNLDKKIAENKRKKQKSQLKAPDVIYLGPHEETDEEVPGSPATNSSENKEEASTTESSKDKKESFSLRKFFGKGFKFKFGSQEDILKLIDMMPGQESMSPEDYAKAQATIDRVMSRYLNRGQKERMENQQAASALQQQPGAIAQNQGIAGTTTTTMNAKQQLAQQQKQQRAQANAAGATESAADRKFDSKAGVGKGGDRSLKYLRIIASNVDGQLDGVGSNVYKTRKILEALTGVSGDNVGSGNRDRTTFMGRVGRVIKMMIFNPVAFVGEIIKKPFEVIFNVGKKIYDTAWGIVEGVGNLLTKSANMVFETGKKIVELAIEIPKMGIDIIKSAVGVIAETAKAGIKVIGEGLVGTVKAAFSIINGAAKAFGKIIGGIGSAIGDTFKGIGKLSKELLKGVGKAIGGTIDIISSVGKATIDIGSSMVQAFTKVATEGISAVGKIATKLIGGVTDLITSAAGTLFSIVASPFKFLGKLGSSLIQRSSHVIIDGGSLETVKSVSVVELVRKVESVGGKAPSSPTTEPIPGGTPSSPGSTEVPGAPVMNQETKEEKETRKEKEARENRIAEGKSEASGEEKTEKKEVPGKPATSNITADMAASGLTNGQQNMQRTAANMKAIAVVNENREIVQTNEIKQTELLGEVVNQGKKREGFLSKILSWLVAAGLWLKGKLNDMLKALGAIKLANVAADLFKGLKDKIITIGQDFLKGLKEKLPKILGKVFEDAKNKIIGAIGKIGEKSLSLLKGSGEKIFNFVKGLGSKIWQKLTGKGLEEVAEEAVEQGGKKAAEKGAEKIASNATIEGAEKASQKFLAEKTVNKIGTEAFETGSSKIAGLLPSGGEQTGRIFTERFAQGYMEARNRIGRELTETEFDQLAKAAEKNGIKVFQDEASNKVVSVGVREGVERATATVVEEETIEQAGKVASSQVVAEDLSKKADKWAGMIQKGLEALEAGIEKATGKKIAFSGPLGNKIKGILTKEIIIKFASKFAAGAAKVYAAAATFGISELILGIINGAMGIHDAAHMFQINKDAVTMPMRICAAAVRAILGSTPLIMVDIALIIIGAIVGWDPYAWFAQELYGLISDDQAVQELEAEQAKFKQEAIAAGYTKGTDENGNPLADLEKYNDEVNKTAFSKLADGFHEFKNSVGNTWRSLFGGTDEQGNETKGWFAEQSDKIDEAGGWKNYLYGKFTGAVDSLFEGAGWKAGTTHDIINRMVWKVDGAIGSVLHGIFGTSYQSIEFDDEGNESQVFHPETHGIFGDWLLESLGINNREMNKGELVSVTTLLGRGFRNGVGSIIYDLFGVSYEEELPGGEVKYHPSKDGVIKEAAKGAIKAVFGSETANVIFEKVDGFFKWLFTIPDKAANFYEWLKNELNSIWLSIKNKFFSGLSGGLHSALSWLFGKKFADEHVSQGRSNSTAGMNREFSGGGVADENYLQTNYTGVSYGNEPGMGDFSKAGCAPSVMSKVINETTGSSVSPTDMGELALSNGYRVPGGTSESFLGDVASHFGVGSSHLDSFDQAVGAAMSGEHVVLGGKGSSYISGHTDAGHYQELEYVDGSKAGIFDPLKGHKEVSLSSLANQTETAYAFSGGGIADDIINELKLPDFNSISKDSPDGAVTSYINKGIDWMIQSGGPFGVGIKLLLAGFKSTANWVFGPILENVDKSVGLVQTAISTGMKYVFGSTDGNGNAESGVFGKFFDMTVDRIKETLSWIFGDKVPSGNLVGDIVKVEIPKVIMKFVNDMKDGLQKKWDEIKQALFDSSKFSADTIFDTFKKGLEWATNKLSDKPSSTGRSGTGDNMARIARYRKNKKFTGGGDAIGDDAVKFVRSMIGKPYVWGGTSETNGVDCSGLVYVMANKLGMSIERTSDNQYDQFKKEGFLHGADLQGVKPGDPIFSRGSSPGPNGVGHVGVYIGNKKMVEAMGSKWGVVESDYNRGQVKGFGDLRGLYAKQHPEGYKGSKVDTSGGAEEGGAGTTTLKGKGLADAKAPDVNKGNGREKTEGIVLHHLGMGSEGHWDNKDYSAHEISQKVHNGSGPNIPSGIGYHFLIRQNGDIEGGRNIESFGAHTIHDDGRPSNLDNSNAVGIVFSGTFEDSYKPTQEQIDSGAHLIHDIAKKYNFPVDDTHVVPHEASSLTGCPGTNLKPLIPGMIKDAAEGKSTTTGGAPAGSGGSGSSRKGLMDLLTESMNNLFDAVDMGAAGKVWTPNGEVDAPAAGNGAANSNPDGTGAPVAGSDNMSEEEIFKWFRSKGYSKEVTAGIMGRMIQENGYKPTYAKFGYSPSAGGTGEYGGFGMFQWTYGDGRGYEHPDPLGADKEWAYANAAGSRLVKYMKWVDSNNKGNYESSKNELEYLYDRDMKDHESYAHESRTVGNSEKSVPINSWYPNDFNKLNMHQAAVKWTNDYEIGVEGNEQEYAKEIYGKYAGAGLGDRFIGGGNELYIPQQTTSTNCTLTATAALMNAYKGTKYSSNDFDFSGPNWWYQNLLSMPAEEKIFGPSEKEGFVNYLNSNFGAKPEHPMLLYQVGGDGHGSHPVNANGGTHATVVGRRLSDGNYEVFNSSGGKIQKLTADQIFDPTASRGGNGYPSGVGNVLFNPQIDPNDSITKWSSEKGSSSEQSGNAGDAPAQTDGSNGNAPASTGNSNQETGWGSFQKIMNDLNTAIGVGATGKVWTPGMTIDTSSPSGNTPAGDATTPGDVSPTEGAGKAGGKGKENIPSWAEKHYIEVAERASKISGIPTDWIWAQWANEAGRNFDSRLAKENHNLAGTTVTSDMPGTDDGGMRWGLWNSDEAFADYWGKYITKWEGSTTAKTMHEYVDHLQNQSDGMAYCTDPPGTEPYYKAMRGILGNDGTDLRSGGGIGDLFAGGGTNWDLEFSKILFGTQLPDKFKDGNKSAGEKPVETIDEVAPNGKKYEKNDVDYLLKQGYTKESALALLATHEKYAKNDNIAPNGIEYSKNDIDYLLKNGFTREAAIDLLSKDKKYTEPVKPTESAGKPAESANKPQLTKGKRKYTGLEGLVRGWFGLNPREGEDKSGKPAGEPKPEQNAPTKPKPKTETPKGKRKHGGFFGWVGGMLGLNSREKPEEAKKTEKTYKGSRYIGSEFIRENAKRDTSLLGVTQAKVSSFTGGEYFNDNSKVLPVARTYIEGVGTLKDVAKGIGFSDVPSEDVVLTPGMQQALGYREYNSIRTWGNYLLDSEMWKSSKMLPVDRWLTGGVDPFAGSGTEKRFVGGGWKTKALSWLTKGIVTNETYDQIVDKLDEYPRIQKALDIVGYADPLSILSMPFESANQLEEDLRTGKITPQEAVERFSYKEDDFYGGGATNWDLEFSKILFTTPIPNKPKDGEKPEGGNEPETIDVVAPNGKKFEKNDVDYLIKNGYTQDGAIAFLSTHEKYAKSENSDTVGPNGLEYSKNDIDYLLKQGYTREAAIDLLSKDKKYTEPITPEKASSDKPKTEAPKQQPQKGKRKYTGLEGLVRGWFGLNPREGGESDKPAEKAEKAGKPAEKQTDRPKPEEPKKPEEAKKKGKRKHGGFFGWVGGMLGLNSREDAEDESKKKEKTYKGSRYIGSDFIRENAKRDTKIGDITQAKVSSFTGGEYFNDSSKVALASRLYVKGVGSLEDVAKVIGFSSIPSNDTNLTAGMQQALGYREYNPIRTWGNYLVDSEMWKHGGEVSVDSWTGVADAFTGGGYDNIAGYNGLTDNLITSNDDIGVQRSKYRAQLEWMRKRTVWNPFQIGTTSSIQYDELGNIIGLDIPEYNRITADDSISVKRAKQKAQLDQYYKRGAFAGGGYENIAGYDGLKDNLITSDDSIAVQRAKYEAQRKWFDSCRVWSPMPSSSIQYDELGNIIGLDIPEYNRITADDSISVKRAKQKAQLDQYYKRGAFAGGGYENIAGYDGLKDNLILPDDSNLVKEAKFEAQQRWILENIQKNQPSDEVQAPTVADTITTGSTEAGKALEELRKMEENRRNDNSNDLFSKMVELLGSIASNTNGLTDGIKEIGKTGPLILNNNGNNSNNQVPLYIQHLNRDRIDQDTLNAMSNPKTSKEFQRQLQIASGGEFVR